MISAGVSSGRGVVAPARHGAENGRDEPLLARVMGVTGLMLWEVREPGLVLTSLQAGVGPSLDAGCRSVDPGPEGRWMDVVHSADRERVREQLIDEETARCGRAVEYRLLIAGGGILWVRHWVLHRLTRRGGERRLQGVLLPIPEQKRLERECLRMGERERTRIGQELHDDLCQVLAGLSFMLHRVGEGVARTDADLAAEVDGLNTEIAAVTERVRTLARGLFPAGLDHAGLRDALQDCADHARQRFAVGVDLELPRRLPPHSPDQVLQVYRIVQEAVSNAVRHGGARRLRMAVSTHDRAVDVQIDDDGRGFAARNGEPQSGIGLHVMEYRARVLGGTLHLGNHPPHGASVRLHYPVARPVEAGTEPKLIP
jgi:signal transduction histidine kinase